MNITIEKLNFEELRQRAVDTHNAYYEERAEKAGNFHIDLRVEDVPEDILQEWMIALIQDEMVKIEESDCSSIACKMAVLEKIKEIYPELTSEVNRHLSIFQARMVSSN